MRLYKTPSETHDGSFGITLGAVIGITTLLGLATLVGCGKKPASTAEASGPPPGAAKTASATAVAVSVTPALTKDISQTVEVTGSLAALQDVIVGAKKSGKLAFVNLHEGDSVHAGQVVAEMDKTGLRAQLQQQQANLQSAITKMAQAQATLEQARTALQNAQTNLKWTDQTTRTAVVTAQANLQSSKENLAIVKAGARTQERQQAIEAVHSAQANFQKAQSDLKRYQELYREQAISQSQLDQAQATFDATQAAYNSAQQALSLMQEGARPEDIRRAELSVAEMQSALNKAQADRSQVALRADDVQNARVGVVSAQAGIEAAHAGIAQVQAAVRIAQDDLYNADIRSPIDGYVAERRAEPGQELGDGGAVMRLVNPASVYFEAVISESQFEQVRLGQSVAITVDAVPQSQPFQGTISRILPVASSSARSFTVRVDLQRPDPRLRSAMFARGRILIATHKNATLVSKDAVVFDPISDRTHLFVVGADGKAEERPVRIGYSNPQYVEIVSGVRPGDQIITSGQNSLQNGDKVQVQQG